MSVTFSLPYIPRESDWPLPPVYVGQLDDETIGELVSAGVIVGDEQTSITKAVRHLWDEPTKEKFQQFSEKFKYRQYQAHPVAPEWSSQSEPNFYVNRDSGLVARLYTHPFSKSPTSDVLIEMHPDGQITVSSVMGDEVAVPYTGDKDHNPVMCRVGFNEEKRRPNYRLYGEKSKFLPPNSITLSHSEQFFEQQRATALGQDYQHIEPEISDEPYALYRFRTKNELRLTQYYDQVTHYLFHNQAFHPGYFDNVEPEEIAKTFSYDRLYACDLILPKGTLVTGWASDEDPEAYVFTFDEDADMRAENVRRIVPPDEIWKPGQEERYNKASSILDSSPDSPQDVISLFDPQIDADSSTWNALVALAYSNPRSPIYDVEKSYNFDIRAAQLGSSMAAYNLGLSWKEGYFGRVDIEKAKFWLARSFNEGNQEAGPELFEILRKDPRFSEEGSDFREAATAIFERSRMLGGDTVDLYDAHYLLRGELGELDTVSAMELYRQLTETNDVTVSAPVFAMYLYAARSYLGLDVPSDPDKALEVLDRIPEGKNDDIVPPTLKLDAERLRDLINQSQVAAGAISYRDPVVLDAEKLIAEGEQVALEETNSAMPVHTELTPNSRFQTHEIIQRLYSGELSFEEAKQSIRNGGIKATPELREQLWVVCSLLGYEGSQDAKYWIDILKEANMKLLDVTEGQVRASTHQFGPQYNRLSDSGYLIPASFDANTIPKDGDAYFRGIQASKDGEITFFFEQSSNAPAMIFGQDIDVALALAFHPFQSLQPSQSLEQLDENLPDRSQWTFEKKEWQPRWIGHTMIGQTLYAADYWLGELAWNSKNFPTGPEDIPDNDRRSRIASLLNDFELCGGYSNGIAKRVMLKPGEIHATWNTNDSGDIICDIHRVSMGVDGSNIAMVVDPETNTFTENQLLNLNDTKFEIGRVASLLTARYDEVAEHFPLFERARQIVGLINTLVVLRDKYGFQPSAALTQRVDDVYQFYANKPAIPLRQRLSMPLAAGD